MDNVQKFLRQNTEDIWRRTFRTQKSDSDCENTWLMTIHWECTMQITECTIQTKRRDKTKDTRLTENWNNQSDIIVFNLCGCVFHYIFRWNKKLSNALQHCLTVYFESKRAFFCLCDGVCLYCNGNIGFLSRLDHYCDFPVDKDPPISAIRKLPMVTIKRYIPCAVLNVMF